MRAEANVSEAITLGKLIEQYGPELAKAVVIAWFAMFKIWPWLTATVDKWMEIQRESAKFEREQSQHWVQVIEQLKGAIDKFTEVTKVQHDEVLRRFEILGAHAEIRRGGDGRS